MAIGFLAPQHPDPSASVSHHGRDRQDSRSMPIVRPQLQALAYGVNVRASLDVRLPGNMSSRPPPTFLQHAPYTSRPPSLCSSLNSTPATSPDHGCLEDPDRAPRERRDPYSDEMRFFIMFARIVKEHDWRKIEDDFELVFNQRRPRDGLTAVYYRIRTSWGMQQVLKNGPDRCKNDIDVVNVRAQDLPPSFLRRIGYLR
ncbi:hypothetical protein AAFC00_003999 [Neodothiora populina]